MSKVKCMYWGRISAAIIAMGFAAWTAGSDWSSGVQYEPLISFFVAFCSWLALEFADSRPSAVPVVAEPTTPVTLSPNDLRLARHLRGAFPSNTRRFLREHSFGQVYHNSKIETLEQISYDWKGTEFEFDDSELRTLADATVDKTVTLLDKLATYSGPATRYPDDSYSIPTDHERATDTFAEHTQKHIAEVDQLASDLLASYEEFERAFRKKAPAEFG